MADERKILERVLERPLAFSTVCLAGGSRPVLMLMVWRPPCDARCLIKARSRSRSLRS
jgi:hypothetical protein